MDGTVTEILGYPTLFLIKDASIPAVSAPINAAAAGGNFAISTSSSRNVFAIAPIAAATAANRTGLLNIIENPNTPQKLASMRKRIHPQTGNDIFIKSTGCRCSKSAMIHAVIVATRIIISAYVNRSIPERISNFAKSIPLVINGKPGIINNIAHIYPASCCVDNPHKSAAIFNAPAYTRQAADTDDTIHKNKVK